MSGHQSTYSHVSQLNPAMGKKQSSYHVKSVKVAKCRLLTTHSGVCCWVSYTKTASCVATAYTIRYGNAKTGAGLALAGVSSPSAFFETLVDDGGSIDFSAEESAETTGSGRDANVSSPDEVSMVI